MNKIIESNVEENLAILETDLDWRERDLEVEEIDMTAAIFDAHDDPC